MKKKIEVEAMLDLGDERRIHGVIQMIHARLEDFGAEKITITTRDVQEINLDAPTDDRI